MSFSILHFLSFQSSEVEEQRNNHCFEIRACVDMKLLIAANAWSSPSS